ADDAVRDEYQVKAAFLFNFVKFVQWPEAGGPLVIGIVGDSPIKAPLRDAVKGRNAGGRSLQVRRVDPEDDLSAYHVIYISESEARRTPALLLRFGRAPVLTVGETVPFLREGGMVRFFVEQNRVRFQINAGAADSAGLRINSQLLSLAAGQ
ncbi:MAG: YfiR family protein, partial [Vicinamibacterales bacterium]